MSHASHEKVVGGYFALNVSGIGISHKAVGSDEGYVDGAFGAGHGTEVVKLEGEFEEPLCIGVE